MEISITFPEIQRFIKNKTGKDARFSMINPKTVKVIYTFTVKIPLLSKVEKGISLNVSLEDICGADIRLAYDCGKLADLLISKAHKFIKGDPKLNFIEFGASRQIMLRLGGIDHVKDVLDKVDIQSVNFTETGVKVICQLKDL